MNRAQAASPAQPHDPLEDRQPVAGRILLTVE